MAKALLMVHDGDPKEAIWDKVKPYLDGIEVMGADVLLGIYTRSGKTAGGLYLPGQTLKEDEFQGKAAMVLKLGPLAFQDSANAAFPIKAKPGDWVAVRVGDTFQLKVGEQPCRIAEDVDIKLIVQQPDCIY